MKKIVDTSETQRRIDPEEIRKALGAEEVVEYVVYQDDVSYTLAASSRSHESLLFEGEPKILCRFRASSWEEACEKYEKFYAKMIEEERRSALGESTP